MSSHLVRVSLAALVWTLAPISGYAQIGGTLLVDIGYAGAIGKKLQRSRPFNNALTHAPSFRKRG